MNRDWQMDLQRDRFVSIFYQQCEYNKNHCLDSSFNFIRKKDLKFTKDSQLITVICNESLLLDEIDKGDSTRRHFIEKGVIF